MTNKTQFKVGDRVEVIDVKVFKENVAGADLFWELEALDEANTGVVDFINESSGSIYLKDNCKIGGVLFPNEQQYIRKVGGQDV